MALRPGGPLHEQPIVLPEKDKQFSTEFWAQNPPPGTEQAMFASIFSQTNDGASTLAMFAGRTEDGERFDAKSLRRMSAYRALAFRHGILVGPYEYHENAGTVTARMFALHQVTDKIL